MGSLRLGFLYGLSSVLYFIFKYLVKYRKKVILSNLQNSFPDWSPEQINTTVNTYYRYLSDLIVESIHLQNVSSNSLLQRVTFDHPEVLEAFEKPGSKVIIMMGHAGNWEWAGLATAARFNFQMMPVYRKIKDQALDDFMIRLRGRFNAIPTADKVLFEAINGMEHAHAIALLADQTPPADKGIWMNFLNQDTPFYRGAEILFHKKGYDVIFAHVFLKKRGYYNIHLQPYQAKSGEVGELTASFALFLEEQIKKQPANWLWSHKRWKHKMPDKGRRYYTN